MMNLKDLEKSKEYYIIDENGCYDPTIIKFKIIKELKNGRKKEYVEIQFTKYICDYSNEETDINFENDIPFNVKIFKEDEPRLFPIEDSCLAIRCLHEAETQKEIEKDHDFDNYDSPSDYPDWDGDESIMYIIDNYHDDENDEIYNLYNLNMKDLNKLMKYFNLRKNDINTGLIEFLKYLGLSGEELVTRAVINYLFEKLSVEDILNATKELDIDLSDNWFDE